MSVPGVSSHHIMLPQIRVEELQKINIADKNPRNAAVMLFFYPKDGMVHLALILRPVYKGVHSGQVALPGGKVELEDNSFSDAALRETWEEIGVRLGAIAVVKAMTKVYIPPSNFWVHPFFGFMEDTPQFILQEEEVAEVIEVSLVELLNEANVGVQNLSTSYAQNIEVPIIKLNGYTVWGATAMMLNELKVLLKTAIEL